MVITYGKLLYYHGVAEVNMDKKISILEYNNRTGYDCFNDTFTDEFGSPDLHLPPITIDDRSCSYKRARYNPDLLPDAISVDSKNYVSTLTNPLDSPDLLYFNDPNTLHVMNKYVHLQGGLHMGYCCRKHGQNICCKNTSLYCSTCSDKNNKFCYCRGFSRISSDTSTCFLEYQHSMSQFFS